MAKAALFSFDVQKEARKITVDRSFNAPLDPVWAAWTEADILCQWWAPKPYQCVIKSLDFRAGGRWLYYMQGPQGDPALVFLRLRDHPAEDSISPGATHSAMNKAWRTPSSRR
jgi:hypothetical protein